MLPTINFFVVSNIETFLITGMTSEQQAEEEIDKADTPPQFETVSVLRLIKDAQQKHGLRQGNYLRYR